MAPTIADGQRIRVTEANEFSRLDIVVYRPPTEDAWFVGRVIGLPGETMEVVEGTLLLGGEVWSDVVAVNHHYDLLSVTVPEGAFFILGDNRSDSYDSHVFGPVSASSIVGIVEVLP